MNINFSRRSFGLGIGGVIAATSLPGIAVARSENLKRLESALAQWIARIVDNGWVSGASVRVIAPDAIPLEVLGGFADREAQTPTTTDTIYRIYSMSKPITAAAMMALVEDGTVSLDQPIADFLPEFRDPQVFVRFEGDEAITEPAARPITILSLLTHTSGLSESFNQGLEPTADIYQKMGLVAGQFAPSLGITSLRRYSETVASIPLAFQPGTRWLYGSSLDVAGRVIEVAAGQDFASFVHQRITGPLCMVDTSFTLPADKRVRLAAMYVAAPDGSTRRLDPPLIPAWGEDEVIPMGGGGLFSTLHDYTRFCRMLLGKGELDGNRVLCAESVATMMSDQLPPAVGPEPLSQAARFGLGGEVGGLGFGLGGSVMRDPTGAGGVGTRGEYAWGGAASTTFWVDPAKRIAVVLMTQKLPSGVHPLRDQLRRIVYDTLR